MREALINIFGIFGIVFFILSFQAKNSRVLLALQMLGSISYASQFIVLEAYTGSLTLWLVALNYLICSTKSRWDSWPGWKWLFSVLIIVSSVITWSGWLSLLPCVAALVSCNTSWSRNGKLIRISRLFAVYPLWLVYDFCSGSLSGALSEIINIVSILLSIHRYGLKELDHKDD